MSRPDDLTEEEQPTIPNQRSHVGCGIILLCFIGGFLLLWPYENDRSLDRYRYHLDIIDSQLQGLKELLRDYKNRSGHYPNNNEGLAALDNFESRFTITYADDREETGSWGFRGTGGNRYWWETAKQAIEAYRSQHGKMPQNEKEFYEAIYGIQYYPTKKHLAQGPFRQREIGIDRHGNVFLLDRSGILSPWLLPYNYENRVGCTPNAFRGSIADGDRWGCSVRVDDGVYLASAGGYVYAGELNGLWWHRYGPRFFGVGLILFAIVVAVIRVVRTKLARPLFAVVAVIPGFLFGGFLHAAKHATCYVMSELFSHRTPEMVSLQQELLEGFRKNGVINEATYLRAKSAVVGAIPEPDDEAENRDP